MVLAGETIERPVHPLHAIILSFPIALFTGAVTADIAYLATAQIQWTNFASWLIAGGVMFSGFTVLWALIAWFAGMRRAGGGRRLVYLLAVAAMFITGLINAFHHSRDAWSSVETAGLTMSIVCAVLALLAGLLRFSRSHVREV